MDSRTEYSQSSSSSDNENQFSSSPLRSPGLDDEGYLSDGTPLSPIFCLKKNKGNMKDFDDKYECFILDFDPFESAVDMSSLSLINAAVGGDGDGDDDDDIAVVAEKGKTEEKRMDSRTKYSQSSSSSDKKIEFSSSPLRSPGLDDEGYLSDGTPLSPIFCLKKNKGNMKDFDDKYECFILDFDPFESAVDMSNLSLINAVGGDGDDDDDIAVVAEKGKLACRDYPHPRHICLNFPFNDSPHESYCKQCFCYVCDSPAACKLWTNVQSGHCHATEHGEEWKFLRQLNTNKKVVGET